MKVLENVMREAEAMDAGYECVAGPYDSSSAEVAMFDRAMQAYRGCDVVIVPQLRGREIWRHARELVHEAVPEALKGVPASRGRTGTKLANGALRAIREGGAA